jgi:hypothetical protein
MDPASAGCRGDGDDRADVLDDLLFGGGHEGALFGTTGIDLVE